MSLKNCFQESAVATCIDIVHYQHPISSKEKLHLPSCEGPPRFSTLSMSSAHTIFAHSLNRRCRIICKARETLYEVEVVTHCSWNNLVIASEIPVLVECWAPPCQAMAPVVGELAREYAGKIQCYKLNTDEWSNIASQYGIQSVPAVLFFKDGERKESIIGAAPKSTLIATIEKYLNS